MPFEKQILIDGRGHLLGRLASIVAKELLLGRVVVAAEAGASGRISFSAILAIYALSSI